MGDLVASAFSTVERCDLAFCQAGEAVLQAGGEADRVGLAQAGCRNADLGAERAMEGNGDGGLLADARPEAHQVGTGRRCARESIKTKTQNGPDPASSGRHGSSSSP